MQGRNNRLGVSVLCWVCLALVVRLGGENQEGQKSRVLWETKSASNIKVQEDNTVIIENHHFLFNPCTSYRRDVAGSLVILQKITWRIGAWEGNDPTLEALAYEITPKGSARTLWSKKEVADEGKLNCDYYETIWYGCCGAENNHHLYHLKTGALIMEYCGELQTVEIPNSKMKRFVGYKSVNTETLNSWEKEKNYVGTLTYASPDRILRRMVLKSAGDMEKLFGIGSAIISLEPGDKRQKLQGHMLDLWEKNHSQNPKDFGGFKIVLRFYEGTIITVPVQEDDFYLPQKKFKGYEFQRVGE